MSTGGSEGAALFPPHLVASQHADGIVSGARSHLLHHPASSQ